jgi:hypothetical protein
MEELMKAMLYLIIDAYLWFNNINQLCGWHSQGSTFFGLAYQGKDIVFRFIIEYSSLSDFGP